MTRHDQHSLLGLAVCIWPANTRGSRNDYGLVTSGTTELAAQPILTFGNVVNRGGDDAAYVIPAAPASAPVGPGD